MTIWQIVLLVVIILFAVLAVVSATDVPSDSGSAMPIFGLLLCFFFVIIAVILAVILGLTFLL